MVGAKPSRGVAKCEKFSFGKVKKMDGVGAAIPRIAYCTLAIIDMK
jgi:hypothetical protein